MNYKSAEFDLQKYRVLRDFCVVKVYEIYRNKTHIVGQEGKTIQIAIEHDISRYTGNRGIVTSVPMEMSNIPIAQDYKGIPKYSEFPSPEFKRSSDIPLEVQVGDKVYFHWSCLRPPSERPWDTFNQFYLGKITETIQGQSVTAYYYRIKYELIFACVRYRPVNAGTQAWTWEKEHRLQLVNITDKSGIGTADRGSLFTEKGTENLYRKQIQMIGSYVFIEPDMENWDDILHPVQAVGSDGKLLTDRAGMPVMKPKSEWIQMKVAPEERQLQGWVRYVGSPLKGDNCEIQTGDYVHFVPKADTKINFEGKDYYRMRQRHIQALAVK